jgi:hypothetical protein
MAILPIACFAGLMIYLGGRLIRSGLGSEGVELWLGMAFVPAGLAIVPPDAQWTLQVIRASVLMIGVPMLAGIWLAFFPPAPYTRWITERAAA